MRPALRFAIVFAVFYGGASWWTSQHAASLPNWNFAFEQRVPFVPAAAIVYLTITPVLAYLLLRHRSAAFANALCVETMLASICFVALPQTVAWTRPHVTNWAFRLADAMNLDYNQFPSLHVAFAVSVAIAYGRKWLPWCIAVALSTWLMWEHNVIDVAGGVALAFLVTPLVFPRTHLELVCLAQCARFSRRHVRYFVIFLAIYGPSLLHWRRYRDVRIGFVAAQWIDDLLDGDRPSEREPLEIVDELLAGTSAHPLARLVDAVRPRDEFFALIRNMRVDRVRVLERAKWTEARLDAHHRITFTHSMNLLLLTTRCNARAADVPSLVDALAWCSVVRDLADDQRKGLDNIPADVDFASWSHASLLRVRETLRASEEELVRLGDKRARRILGIFQRSVEKYARREVLVTPRGFEPPTKSLGNSCSIRAELRGHSVSSPKR